MDSRKQNLHTVGTAAQFSIFSLKYQHSIVMMELFAFVSGIKGCLYLLFMFPCMLVQYSLRIIILCFY